MDKIKNKKIFYIGVCVAVILICIVVCVFFDTDAENDYNNLEIIENVDNTNNIEVKEEMSEEKVIYIHITGEVVNPGVIVAKEGDRIKDVVEQAGGLTSEADTSKVNLAFKVSDGQKIVIPNIKEKNEEDNNVLNKERKTSNSTEQNNVYGQNNNKTVKNNNYVIEDSGENIVVDGTKAKNEEKVNINTATQTELETLTGIGPSTASKIIEYRKENGSFKTIEDIKNVKGIGDAKYKKIKNDIVAE